HPVCPGGGSREAETILGGTAADHSFPGRRGNMVTLVGNYSAELIPPIALLFHVAAVERLHHCNRDVADGASLPPDYTDLRIRESRLGGCNPLLQNVLGVNEHERPRLRERGEGQSNCSLAGSRRADDQPLLVLEHRFHSVKLARESRILL